MNSVTASDERCPYFQQGVAQAFSTPQPPIPIYNGPETHSSRKSFETEPLVRPIIQLSVSCSGEAATGFRQGYIQNTTLTFLPPLAGLGLSQQMGRVV